AQDAELFLFGAPDPVDLGRRAEQLIERVSSLSYAELTDLAVTLARTLGPSAIRAAVVASTAAQLHERLGVLRSWLLEGRGFGIDGRAGVFLGTELEGPRVGLLFPGQGSPVYLDGGALGRRFARVRELYARSPLPREGPTQSTVVAQPAIVTASLAGLRALQEVGIEAVAAVGHSLGEIVALHWAGAVDPAAAVRIAAARGCAMAALAQPTDRKSTRLNSSHRTISYAVFCLKKKKKKR